MEIRKIKNYTVTCSDCGSELSFEDSDMFSQPHEVFNRKGMTENIVSWWFIKCPICGKEIHVRYEKEFCDKVKFRYHDLGKSEKENKMTTTLDNINTNIKSLESKIETVLDIILESLEISEEKKAEIEAERTTEAIKKMTSAVENTETYQKWIEEVKAAASKKQEYKENGIEGFQTPECEDIEILTKDLTIYKDKDLFREAPNPFHERDSKIYILTDTYLEYFNTETYRSPLIPFIVNNSKEDGKILLVGFPNLELCKVLTEGLPTRIISLLTDNEKLKESTNTSGPVLYVSDLDAHFADFNSLYDLVIWYKDFNA